MLNKVDFLRACHEQLVRVYSKAQAGTPDDRLKHRAEGFIHAGQVIGLITAEEALAIIESTHRDVFGETVQQRRARKASLAELKQHSPDVYYEIPAIERRR